MRRVRPYSSLTEAMDALDNGGRFYHWSSHAGDQLVTAAEMRKEAGILARDHLAVLHFAVATSKLTSAEVERLRRALADDARQMVQKYAPLRVDCSDFATTVEVGQRVLVEGDLRRIDDDERLGFVPVTTMVNNVPMTTSTPTGRVFTVYELDGVPGCEVMVPRREDELAARMLFAGEIKLCSVGKKRFTESEAQEFPRLAVEYAAEV